MHSTDATILLRSTHDDAALHALLASLGFPTTPLPLDELARERLGLPPDAVLDARVARGDGVLRALVLDLAPHASIRDAVALVARRISMRVPQLLWLLVARAANAAPLAIATWHGTPTPRLAALITDRDHVTASDAETLCALVAASRVTPDGVRHLRWVETLGRESVTRRFFGALRGAVTTMTDALTPTVPDATAREMALLTACRLLFLSFIETKGWLAGDYAFLTNSFAECMGRGGGYHRTVLESLFFGTLNTPPRDRAPRARSFGAIPFLNGGLFTRTALERRFRHTRFSDDALGASSATFSFGIDSPHANRRQAPGPNRRSTRRSWARRSSHSWPPTIENATACSTRRTCSSIAWWRSRLHRRSHPHLRTRHSSIARCSGRRSSLRRASDS